MLKETDEYYTPAGAVLAAARRVLGAIDVDPASCDLAQQTIQAKIYYTSETNGLAQDWPGRVWLNMPYSKPQPWVEKLLASYAAGITTAACLLCNAANTPKWAQLLWHSQHTVCLLNKRIQFYNPYRKAGDSNRSDQMLWYLGPHDALFVKAFAPLGAIRYPLPDTHCIECTRPFNAKRSDSLYCSPACKQRAVRKRRKSVSDNGYAFAP